MHGTCGGELGRMIVYKEGGNNLGIPPFCIVAENIWQIRFDKFEKSDATCVDLFGDQQ